MPELVRGDVSLSHIILLLLLLLLDAFKAAAINAELMKPVPGLLQAAGGSLPGAPST